MESSQCTLSTSSSFTFSQPVLDYCVNFVKDLIFTRFCYQWLILHLVIGQFKYTLLNFALYRLDLLPV